MKTHLFRGFCILLLCIASLSSAASLHASRIKITLSPICVAAETSTSGNSNENKPLIVINRLSDINKRVVGTLVGSGLDEVVESYFDYLTVYYYENYPLMKEALLSGEIDAIWSDEPVQRARAKADPRLRVLEEKISEGYYGFAVQKNNVVLSNQVNAIMQKLIDTGEMDQLWKKWSDDGNTNKTVPPLSQEKRGVPLRFATNQDLPPFAYADRKSTRLNSSH